MVPTKKRQLAFKNHVGIGSAPLIIGIVLLVIIIGLVVITVQRGVTVPSAGQAISGLDKPATVLYANVLPGQLVINPRTATAAMHYQTKTTLVGEDLTVDVVGNIGGVPKGSKFNNYELAIGYDPLFLKYVSSRNIVPGNWNYQILENKPGLLRVRGEGTNPFADVYAAGETVPFIELTFTPLKLSLKAEEYTIVNFQVPFTAVHSYPITDLITDYSQSGLFYVFTRYYADADKDGYGNPDLSKSTVAFSMPLGYVLLGGDCNDADKNVYPGAAELCNGIDNNCVSGIDDEVLPTCESFNAACGIHRVCANTRYVDCNKGTGGVLLSGTEKCGSGKLCSDGQCVLKTLPIPRSLTPACGNIDPTKRVCDYFEHMLSCPEDCTACPTGVDCAGADTDGDGLSDAYETYLDTQIVTKGFKTGTFSATAKDSDGDGVDDNVDYCPGTNDPAAAVKENTILNGKVNFNGCPTGDVTTEGAGLGADGCLSLKDTTVMLQYYAGRTQCSSSLTR